MPPIALVRASILAPIVGFLARGGARVERLLPEAGLPAWLPVEADGLIPTSSVVRLLNRAVRSEGIADVGLRAGVEARIDALGVLGRRICVAPTVGAALQWAIRNHRAFSSSGRTWLASRGEQVRLCAAWSDRVDEEWQQLEHYALMLMMGIVRLGAGPTWCPPDMRLQTGESAAVRELEHLSGARIRFAQPVTAIGFPRALLDAPLPEPSGVREHSEESLDAWTASGPADDLAASIAQVVETLSWRGYPHIRSTAAALGMSVRTLQRRLGSARVTHESLVANVRFATAAALLEKTDSKIVNIALDLGYSDHAHFTRAFRRWTGRSPNEFRRGSRNTGETLQARQ